jgi:hypothetical protein
MQVMSWTNGYCDCGNNVDYGMYYSQHEDEHSEITVKVVCGECVRERDGIPSEEEKSEGFKIFQNEVEKHGLKGAILAQKSVEEAGSNHVIFEVLDLICNTHDNMDDDDEIRLGYVNLAYTLTIC